MRQFTCPVPACGREAKYDAPIGEEALVPNNDKPVPRKPLGLQRNFWVTCPVHGRRWLLEQGHHVSVKRPPAKK